MLGEMQKYATEKLRLREDRMKMCLFAAKSLEGNRVPRSLGGGMMSSWMLHLKGTLLT